VLIDSRLGCWGWRSWRHRRVPDAAMAVVRSGRGCCGGIRPRRNCRDAALLIPETATKLLQPLRIFHQEWVDERIAN